MTKVVDSVGPARDERDEPVVARRSWIAPTVIVSSVRERTANTSVFKGFPTAEQHASDSTIYS
jgi:hypothetical protein